MSDTGSKPIRSPSYPNMSLEEAVRLVGLIEARYRSSSVDRTLAAKLVGYSSLSGPANKALAALATYGLLERAGKGETRVTGRARAILHADSEDERQENLLAAAFEPDLFREIKERFPDISIPPEEGVTTYLNRQGFNPSAVKPAAKAFRQTMEYVETLRANESHGGAGSPGLESTVPTREPIRSFGGAKVGDLIQWETQGTLQLPRPLRVRSVSDDGEWVAVEGSQTGIPMSQVIVESTNVPGSHSPVFAFDDAPTAVKGETDWIRFRVGPETNVRLLVSGELGPREIGRLIKLLEAQRAVLVDEDD